MNIRPDISMGRIYEGNALSHMGFVYSQPHAGFRFSKTYPSGYRHQLFRVQKVKDWLTRLPGLQETFEIQCIRRHGLKLTGMDGKGIRKPFRTKTQDCM